MTGRIYLYLNNTARRIVQRAKKISFIGFEGIPIYDVVIFFLRGLQKGAITTRAAAIAFHFFLALLPGLIYFITLIPYLPIHNFQEGLLELMQDFMPVELYALLENTLRDMFVKRQALQLFGLLIALFFATNAINGMMIAFNATYHEIEYRSWLQRRAMAAFLVIILFILLTTAVGMILFSRMVVNALVDLELVERSLTFYLLMFGKWLIIIALIYFALSFLYWLAPSRKIKWRFLSAGSTLSTVLVICTSLIFAWVMNNFNQFNKFFGSISTLMIMLLWLYLNSIALLIGFEMNASIKNAQLEQYPDPDEDNIPDTG